MAGMQDVRRMAFFSVSIFSFLTLPLFLGVTTGQANSAADFFVLEHCVLHFSDTHFVASADMSHVNEWMDILEKVLVSNSICIFKVHAKTHAKNVIC
jgi:hypothetical protein